MNRNLLTAGFLIASVAVALPGSAYHMTATAAAPGSQDPHQWGAQFGASDPTGPVCDLVKSVLFGPVPLTGGVAAAIDAQINALPDPPVDAATKALLVSLVGSGGLATVYEFLCPNDTVTGVPRDSPLFGFTTCEANGDATTPSRAGQGGLCFMSSGWGETSAGSGDCVFKGYSNGKAPEFNTVPGACQSGAGPFGIITTPARRWMEINMWRDTTASTAATFAAQVNGVDCTATPSQRVVYDEQFVYTVSDGHVTGFPTQSPSTTGGFGTYSVTDHGSSLPTGLTACAGPQPWYQ